MKSEQEQRREIVKVCEFIHRKGWISSTDGNVSVRLGRDRLLITPSGTHKGFMTPRDLIVIDMEGRLIAGSRKPSSETAMHLACYRQRADVTAVVHAHPTYSVAFSLAGIKLAKCLLPEVVFTLGSIPTAGYAPPATESVAESISCYIKDFDAIILERHGSVTVGRDLMGAYNALERMEHVAEITYHARQLGGARPLTAEQIENLQRIADAQGWPRRRILTDACNECDACGRMTRQADEAASGGDADDGRRPGAGAGDVAEIIAREVAGALRKRA
ncbi:MAG: class II aldolase/adducin family protein [Candidatus Nitrospinota bacterium M3_3B_026]